MRPSEITRLGLYSQRPIFGLATHAMSLTCKGVFHDDETFSISPVPDGVLLAFRYSTLAVSAILLRPAALASCRVTFGGLGAVSTLPTAPRPDFSESGKVSLRAEDLPALVAGFGYVDAVLLK